MNMERASSDGDRNDMPEVCEECTDAVQAVIDFEIGDGTEEFDWRFGDLMDNMHGALMALHRVARTYYTAKHDPDTNSREAARNLVRVREAIDQLIADGSEFRAT